MFRGPNLPYMLALILSAGVLGAFIVVTDPFASDRNATTSAPTFPTTEPTTETATTGSEPTETATTEADDSAAAPDLTTPLVGPEAGPLQGLDLQRLAVSVPFPTFAIGVPGEARILVLERRGRIITIDPTTGVLPTPYLDLQDRVDSSSVENGLLGLAFHPDYSINGRFFVFYTGEDAEARISEFTANPPASATVDPATEQVLLTVEAGFNNRGGMLQFGSDGYLYVGVGDGGAPEEAGEPATLRGTLLRIDVDGGDPYAIPAGNPFGGASGQREVWAIGLRNPWRFSIDGDRLYVGDVGADSWEEINVQPLAAAGVDYGWPLFEGFECQDGEGCDQAGPTDPVLAYSHEEGCAVTAGYVYRGSLLPELEGHFFYADWCNGWIRSFLFEDGEVTEEQDWTEDLADAGQVASFGLDSNGELLVIDSNGNVSRIVAIR